MPNKQSSPTSDAPSRRKVFGRSVKSIEEKNDDDFSSENEFPGESLNLFSNIKGSVKNLFTGKLPTLSTYAWQHPYTCSL